MKHPVRWSRLARLLIAFGILLAGCGPIEGPQDLFDLFLPDPTPTDDVGDTILDELGNLPLGEEPAIRFVSGSKSRANCEEGPVGTACDITARLEVFYTGLSGPGLIRCTDARGNEFGVAEVGEGSGTVELNAFYEFESVANFEDPNRLFADCELIPLGSVQPVDSFTVLAGEVNWEGEGDEPSISLLSASKSRANCSDDFLVTGCDITLSFRVAYNLPSGTASVFCQGNLDKSETIPIEAGSGTLDFTWFYEDANAQIFEGDNRLYANCQLRILEDGPAADHFTIGVDEVEWE